MSRAAVQRLGLGFFGRNYGRWALWHAAQFAAFIKAWWLGFPATSSSAATTSAAVFSFQLSGEPLGGSSLESALNNSTNRCCSFGVASFLATFFTRCRVIA